MLNRLRKLIRVCALLCDIMLNYDSLVVWPIGSLVEQARQSGWLNIKYPAQQVAGRDTI